jgi:hypothetical protein
MVTPTGKLQRDDVIRNKVTGRKWRVIERLGNDELYAVRIVPHEHTQWYNASDRLRGYALMTEVAYWLKHGWEHVP